VKVILFMLHHGKGAESLSVMMAVLALLNLFQQGQEEQDMEIWEGRGSRLRSVGETHSQQDESLGVHEEHGLLLVLGADVGGLHKTVDSSFDQVS
jgi:hypothetical protein